MFNWLWNADTGLMLGALGSITGIASLIYARSQAHGAHAQAEGVRRQAIEALRAAELVAEGARHHKATLVRDRILHVYRHEQRCLRGHLPDP